MYRVLLISYINWDSLIEIPAILKNGGCQVDVFCSEHSWAIQNSAHNAWIPAPTEEKAFVAQLLDLVQNGKTKYDWIIPGDDIIVRLLNEQITDEHLFYKLLPLTKIENRALLGSKAGFSSLCSQYGVQTPAYLIYKDGMTPAEISQTVGYPSLMKVDKSEGGYGIFLCESEADVISNLATITNKENLVIQQMINGYDVNVEVLYRNGELMVYNYSRTTKIMGKFGVSTERLFYANPEIEATLLKIGRSFGLNGFGNVVFMYDEEKKEHYLIEVDTRPNAWMYYGKFTGNDFSEAVRKIIKNDLTVVRPQKEFKNKEIRINLYKKDMYRCIMQKDVKGLLHWATNKNNRWKYIPRNDKKLLRACNAYLYTSFSELFTHKIKKITGRAKR